MSRMVDFSRIGRAELEAMAAAGRELVECRRVLAKSGDTVLGEALGGGMIVDWEHYPQGDVYDPETHAQYFYHAHPAAERLTGEQGHFHTFLRPRGMPAGTRPLIMPELAIADSPAAPAGPAVPQPNQGAGNDELSHLVAIAIDMTGEPFRLFTTNRWVTALFRLFRPQMAELLLARDAAIMSWRRRHRGKIHVFEDRRLEVASAVDVDVDEQLGHIALMLKQVACPRDCG